MNNRLILQTNIDIPFPEAGLTIHQPKIEEIAMISEENFHPGCYFLNFSSDILSNEDKSNLINKSDFEVFMSIMNGPERTKYKVDAMLVLTLIFPDYSINFERDRIVFKKHDDDKYVRYIDKQNYNIFKDILVSMFALGETEEGKSKYNPVDGIAARIAKKFEDRDKKLAKLKGENVDNRLSIFDRMISILAVGECKDKNELAKYTVTQLKDEFKRFQLKQGFDMYKDAKLAGAQDLDEVDNWMEDIHP